MLVSVPLTYRFTFCRDRHRAQKHLRQLHVNHQQLLAKRRLGDVGYHNKSKCPIQLDTRPWTKTISRKIDSMVNTALPGSPNPSVLFAKVSFLPKVSFPKPGRAVFTMLSTTIACLVALLALFNYCLPSLTLSKQFEFYIFN
jgi:hypothetical protein